jgi:hypothetical protein
MRERAPAEYRSSPRECGLDHTELLATAPTRGYDDAVLIMASEKKKLFNLGERWGTVPLHRDMGTVTGLKVRKVTIVRTFLRFSES